MPASGTSSDSSTKGAKLAALIARVEHEDRHKRRKRSKSFWTWASWLTRRINEIEMVLWDRYPDRILPDDDAGYDDLRIVLHHIGRHTGPNVESTMRMWIAKYTPWLDEDEGDALVRYYIASKKKLPKADTLARFMGLNYADRKRIGRAYGKAIRTIGAIDATKAERKAMRKAEQRLADKARQQDARRAASAKPHAESQARTKPWEAEGISRPTYYRRQKAKMAREHRFVEHNTA